MAANLEETRADGREATACASVESPGAVIRRFGISEVEKRTGFERSTVSRRVRAGTFPRPIYLGARRYWAESQLLEWEALQVARQAEAERHVRELMEPAQAAKGRKQ
jgi:prophage regulatory protein